MATWNLADGQGGERNRDNGRAASLPIAWNKSRFSLVKSGYRKVYETSKSREADLGSPKSITWVKLKDIKTSDTFYVVNTHTIASVESKGKPNSDKDRVALYKKHMDVLTSFLKGLQRDNIPIFVLGDFKRLRESPDRLWLAMGARYQSGINLYR